MLKLFDTHAHIDDKQFDADRDEVIKKIRQSGVELLMEVGSDLESSKKAVEIAGSNSFIYSAVGIHPESADKADDEALYAIKKLAASENRVKAIGEIGIDYYYDNCPSRSEQIRCFERQIDIARELSLPIIVHDRRSKGDVMRVLKEKKVERAVLHCFSGSAETAEIFVKMGYMISFTGVITFKNAKKAVEALKAVPLENLMIETDSPYMTPEPHRGKRNDSSYVKFIAEKMAEIKGVTAEELAEITYQNGVKFFNIEEGLN
ncbi:MAG TPA: TatD family hydrolase [Candidatus Monoglobus merdigallinarum]|uniref:TatD family hydrolase n=1 Tax=Candidatus Monoglobus merdigallinarum TaxID=2838698 RepID=A0A9D1PS07_9FIRM|nr:TatD family hydrolase [Candidatus Monoglobus merdigallinarum]